MAPRKQIREDQDRDDIDLLIQKAKDLHSQIENGRTLAVGQAEQGGLVVIEIKKYVKNVLKVNWEPWCEANLFSPRKASQYMKIAINLKKMPEFRGQLGDRWLPEVERYLNEQAAIRKKGQDDRTEEEKEREERDEHRKKRDAALIRVQDQFFYHLGKAAENAGQWREMAGEAEWLERLDQHAIDPDLVEAIMILMADKLHQKDHGDFSHLPPDDDEMQEAAE